MDYILEYKKFNRNILYLHGLDGELNKDYKKIIHDLGFNYIGISVDYHTDNVWDIISKIDIDGVIGHSLGGYMAYYLSNFKKIPALLLMPSFDKQDIKLQTIPGNVKQMKEYKDKIALIGSKDVSVNKKLQKENLKNVKIYEEEMQHDLTNPIFKKYAKIFIDKF